MVLTALEPGDAITQYSHAAWTLQEGKLPGAALALTQTVDGTFWIGTESGLLRFDGVTFSRWSPPAGGRFPIEYVQALAPGRDGSLWIGTLDGLAHLKDGRGHILFHPPKFNGPRNLGNFIGPSQCGLDR